MRTSWSDYWRAHRQSFSIRVVLHQAHMFRHWQPTCTVNNQVWRQCGFNKATMGDLKAGQLEAPYSCSSQDHHMGHFMRGGHNNSSFCSLQHLHQQLCGCSFQVPASIASTLTTWHCSQIPVSGCWPPLEVSPTLGSSTYSCY